MFLTALALAAAPVDLRAEVAEDLPELLELYRHLHANPELSGQEYETAKLLAGKARALGFEVTEGVGGTGVVAVMRNGAGPTLMIRADMDALPLVEQTGLPYASRVTAVAPQSGVETGVMHACGHDLHMAGWLGTAQQMVERKADWSGTLVMILQPAEETGKGARAMLEDGLYTRFPKPDRVIAFHDDASRPAGMLGVGSGYVMANVDSVDVTIRGVGGHGAYPHGAKDPIVAASHFVTALQTLVSRDLDPLENGVVTVGSFHAGAKHNVIPDEAKLLLTVRSYTPEVRAQLLEGIERIATAQALSAGMPQDKMPTIEVRDEFTPSTYNDPPLADRALALFRDRFGEDRVTIPRPVMGGEDFGRYGRNDDSIESLMFRVGAQPMDKWVEAGGDPAKLPSLHSPFFAPDPEPAIATATEALTALALDILKP